MCRSPRGGGRRTEETLGAALLDNLDNAGLQLLNRWDVVGEHTHFTGLGRNVDLDGIVGFVDGLKGCGNKESAFEDPPGTLVVVSVVSARATEATMYSFFQGSRRRTWWGSDKLSLICLTGG